MIIIRYSYVLYNICYNFQCCAKFVTTLGGRNYLDQVAGILLLSLTRPHYDVNVNIADDCKWRRIQMPNLCVHASIYGLHAIVNDANIVLKRIKPLYIVLLINPTV